MAIALEGRRRFRGILLGLEGELVRLRCNDTAGSEPSDVTLAIADMAEARLVLTETLITAALRRSKAQVRALEAVNDNRMQSERLHASDNGGE